MTIDFAPSKQLVVKAATTAAKTAIRFAKDHVQPSVKATPDGFTLTVHVRVRGTGGRLATT